MFHRFCVDCVACLLLMGCSVGGCVLSVGVLFMRFLPQRIMVASSLTHVVASF
jgi:hypothetical protein